MDYKKLSKDYFEEATKTLQETIRIDSVYDEGSITKEAPYGKGVAEVFKYMKALALKEGFEVDMCDNRAIEISFGEGEHTIGIFAHLDVVPVSGEWKYPAFGAEIHDNVMYGRGTSDDKGPAIAAFYALKLLKDQGLVKGYKVKLVLGGDEERGSSCLQYYFNVLKKPQPTYGFTPDGDFPLIYGEKGIRDYKYEGKLDLDPILSIEAGVAPNSVIDDAVVTVKNDGLLKKYLAGIKGLNYKLVKEDNESVTFEFFGKAAHGSTPEKGINSGMIMLNCLAECYNNADLKKFYHDYEDAYGRNINQYYESKYLGFTTYNVGMINYKEGVFSFVVNFRFPETVDSDEVFATLAKDSKLPLIADELAPVVYFDPDNSPFIKALAEVYVRGTGDTINKPLTIGGGTYAKEAKNTVAFGSHFPGKEDNIHSPNEKIDMEDFYGSIPLYADAINTLGNLK